MAKPVEPSPIQLDVLKRIVASGDVELEYRAGGYWTLVGCPERGEGGAPEWFVTWQTVRAMESRGWLARIGGPDGWPRRNRGITEAGRAALAERTERHAAASSCQTSL